MKQLGFLIGGGVIDGVVIAWGRMVLPRVRAMGAAGFYVGVGVLSCRVLVDALVFCLQHPPLSIPCSEGGVEL